MPGAMARPVGKDIEDDLRLLEAKVKQAKFEYEQYFLGNRPREPVMVRGEVQKIIAVWSNMPIRNTAKRFRFNNLCARFFTFRRQWDEINRKIEAGTYEPLNRRIRQRERERERQRGAEPAGSRPSTSSDEELCNAYLEARRACGKQSADLSRDKVATLIERQRKAITERYGCRDVRFRVVVEQGKPKLKATPVR